MFSYISYFILPLTCRRWIFYFAGLHAEYLNDFSEAFILEKVNQIEIKGRKQIGASYKYYFADVGLRNACLDFLHWDDGHVMENVIFNELRYRGYSVENGRVTVWSKNKKMKR